MLNLGFLASHNGSNMQAVVNACEKGLLQAKPSVVISNNKNCRALQFAQEHSIPARHISSFSYPDPVALDQAILDTLLEHKVELVLLVGYMKLLGPRTIAAFRNRILNIHPALLPRYGGKGMYGIRIHEAVVAAKEIETGITIHCVDEEYDKGPIVAQCTVSVLPSDTPERLAERVLKQEHIFIVETLKKILTGEIVLPHTDLTVKD